MVRKKKFFSAKVVIFSYWSFHTVLCVSLALLLKYQELGPRGQAVVCGKTRQRCLYSPQVETGGRSGAVNSPPTGLELCLELCCRQFDFTCDPATAPYVAPKWEGGRPVLSYQVESIPPECKDRRPSCSERPGTGRVAGVKRCMDGEGHGKEVQLDQKGEGGYGRGRALKSGWSLCVCVCKRNTQGILVIPRRH